MLFAFFSPVFSAGASSLILSEVHPSQEFIELQNISGESISLSGYRYSELTGSGKENFYLLGNENILPEDFFVISLSRKINDTGDTIALYSPSDEKISEVSLLRKEEGLSFSFFPEKNMWEWSSPTPGEENIADLNGEEDDEEDENVSEENGEEEREEDENEEENEGELGGETESGEDLLNIKVSEIFPNPLGNDKEGEFIEIFNPYDKSVDITGWILEDEKGKQFVFSGDFAFLKAEEYKAFAYSDTKITINNSDERVMLKTPSGKIISQLSFSGDSKEGYSFTPLGWTDSPTFSQKNIISLPEGEEEEEQIREGQLFEEEYFLLSQKREKPIDS